MPSCCYRFLQMGENFASVFCSPPPAPKAQGGSDDGRAINVPEAPQWLDWVLSEVPSTSGRVEASLLLDTARRTAQKGVCETTFGVRERCAGNTEHGILGVPPLALLHLITELSLSMQVVGELPSVRACERLWRPLFRAWAHAMYAPTVNLKARSAPLLSALLTRVMDIPNMR